MTATQDVSITYEGIMMPCYCIRSYEIALPLGHFRTADDLKEAIFDDVNRYDEWEDEQWAAFDKAANETFEVDMGYWSAIALDISKEYSSCERMGNFDELPYAYFSVQFGD